MSLSGAWQVTLLISTRLRLPTAMPSGPRMRAPSRRNSGALRMLRIVRPVDVTSSMMPPSTVSSATSRATWPQRREARTIRFPRPQQRRSSAR